jgi:hypothetical protein
VRCPLIHRAVRHLRSGPPRPRVSFGTTMGSVGPYAVGKTKLGYRHFFSAPGCGQGADRSSQTSSIRPWNVEFYADEQGHEPCRQRADGLSPRKQAAFTAAVRLVLGRCGLDVAESEFGKARPHGVATSDNAAHAERIGQRREVTERSSRPAWLPFEGGSAGNRSANQPLRARHSASNCSAMTTLSRSPTRWRSAIVRRNVASASSHRPERCCAAPR